MLEINNKNDSLIPIGWVRSLIGFIVFIVLGGLFGKIFFSVLNGEKLYADYKNGININGYLMLNAITSFVTTLFAVYILRIFIDKRSVKSLGFSWKGYRSHAWQGFWLAIAILSVSSVVLMLTKNLQFTSVNFNIKDLLIGAILMLLISFAEEVMVRGYLLNNLMQSINKWPALLITAAIFAAMHLFNPGITFFSFLNIFFAGILLGINYIYTRNLWFGIFLHFMWNYMQGFILGFEVSGVHTNALLSQSVQGNDILTGGKFGLEGSVITIILITVSIFFLQFIYKKKFK